ncbi:hypothetical protein IU483_00605 [Streptomyces gardneri]|nr:hypothetical protein [Streptomyces gardneri]
MTRYNNFPACDVEGCRVEAKIVHRLRETTGFEWPAEVTVCLEHKAQLEAGYEYHWDPTWKDPQTGEYRRRLVVGDLLLNQDGYILKEIRSATVRMLTESSNPDERGPIFKFVVRRPGGPLEELEITIPRPVMAELHEWLGNFVKGKDNS